MFEPLLAIHFLRCGEYDEPYGNLVDQIFQSLDLGILEGAA